MPAAKDKSLKVFESFLERLRGAEGYTSYINPKVQVSKDEVIFTAEGVDEQAPKDPWVVQVIWKKGSNNLFYSRRYKEGDYQTQKIGVRARGDENIAPLFTRLLAAIKRSA